MADELKVFPRGSVAMGNGDLAQVVNVKLKLSSNRKLKHSLRKSPSGFVDGHHEVSGSLDAEVDEAGPERDYFKLVADGTVKQLRLKIASSTLALNVVVTDIDLELSTDDAVKMTVSFIGELVDT